MHHEKHYMPPVLSQYQKESQAYIYTEYIIRQDNRSSSEADGMGKVSKTYYKCIACTL